MDASPRQHGSRFYLWLLACATAFGVAALWPTAHYAASTHPNAAFAVAGFALTSIAFGLLLYTLNRFARACVAGERPWRTR
jgi:Trk-type K+ transport system membrane component